METTHKRHHSKNTSSTYRINHVKLFKNHPTYIRALGLAAKKKAHLSWFQLIVLAFWAGILKAFGCTVGLSAGGGTQVKFSTVPGNWTVPVDPVVTTYDPLARIFLGCFFPLGLMTIAILGGELFTSACMFFMVGYLEKTVTLYDLARSYITTWIFNWAGCVVGALAIWGMGVLDEEPWHSFLISYTTSKVEHNFGMALLRGIGCNFLVCAGIVFAYTAETITGKMMGVWVPVFCFIVSGYEHSVANMFFMTLATFKGAKFSYGLFVWQNLIPVTIGNIIGGALLLGFLSWVTLHRDIFQTASTTDTTETEDSVELEQVKSEVAHK